MASQSLEVRQVWGWPPEDGTEVITQQEGQEWTSWWGERTAGSGYG